MQISNSSGVAVKTAVRFWSRDCRATPCMSAGESSGLRFLRREMRTTMDAWATVKNQSLNWPWGTPIEINNQPRTDCNRLSPNTFKMKHSTSPAVGSSESEKAKPRLTMTQSDEVYQILK
ncbi:hypothetical protein DdX_21748 [Ditylenchus destructor]|uniref:Uncharacterized protein n=1 Tax=Ditylenchus destructor TaxID=166010 RepID=A0AAD4QV99_9BILA|nr:hypothetical protein DdX_21748 [Ditylenchus destructor]